MKCQKWRIYPSRAQRETFRLWLDAARLVYNRAAESANADGVTAIARLREAAGIDAERWLADEATGGRLRDVPYEIRDGSLRDLHKAAKALRAKAKKRGGAGPVVYKFRRRKDLTESVALRKRNLNCKTERGSVWPELFGTVGDRSAMRTERGKRLPGEFLHDTRLFHDTRTNKWYLCIPLKLTAREALDTQGRSAEPPKTAGVVSIDPGVRTFATCYDPDGVVTKWGNNCKALGWIARKAARVEGRAKAAKGRSRKRLHGYAARLRERMRCLASELHHKLALWLCREFSTILLPKFCVRRLSCRARRNISKGTVKDMSYLAHFKFRQFLAHKAAEYGTTLILCAEPWTSKTCGRCGSLHHKLGRSEVFACPRCAYACDRDTNAARNILLRYCVLNEVA